MCDLTYVHGAWYNLTRDTWPKCSDLDSKDKTLNTSEAAALWRFAHVLLLILLFFRPPVLSSRRYKRYIIIIIIIIIINICQTFPKPYFHRTTEPCS